MIQGCPERATIGLAHSFQVGQNRSATDNLFRTLFRNDLWLCPRHGAEVKQYRLKRSLSVPLVTLGLLVAASGFLNAVGAAGFVFGGAGVAAGVGLRVIAEIIRTSNGLRKKQFYIERVSAPEHFGSPHGPWTDKGLCAEG